MAKAKGLEMLNQAKAKEASMQGKWLRPGRSKWEELAERFIKAGNTLKVAKELQEAGRAYVKAAEIYLQASKDNRYDASSNYVTAAKCFVKESPNHAVAAYSQALNIYVEDGRFAMAAKLHKDVGDLLKAESEVEKAIEAYQSAADFFEGEGSVIQANKCSLEVADLSVTLDDYTTAIAIYEKCATDASGSNLGKFGAKKYFLKAGLCHLVKDVVGAKKALEKYVNIQLEFGGQREYKLLQDCIEAVEAYDLEAFQKAVRDYDSLTRLDRWHTSLLLKVKNTLDTEGGDDLENIDSDDDIC
mmetsp:Transcript_15656/g.17403  ORF Transcript_15656/g.17403 Transcript_15656/m.17403 type:complete len:301 (+) Transcript_15656:55-957(+)